MKKIILFISSQREWICRSAARFKEIRETLLRLRRIYSTQSGQDHSRTSEKSMDTIHKHIGLTFHAAIIISNTKQKKTKEAGCLTRMVNQTV